jgi:hypothetical protein
MILQYSMHAIVQTIPESIAYLRGGLYRRPKAAPEGADESKPRTRPAPKAPMDLGALDAADLQLDNLAFWAEECGVDMTDLGRTWRYAAGHPRAGDIRGVLYDDARPADRLRARLLDRMNEPDYQEAEGMHAHLHTLMARHATTWPVIHDLLNHYSGIGSKRVAA